MRIRKTVLDNGLRVVSVPMTGTDAATVMVFVRAGARTETSETNGLSHFIEHMLFKGGLRYPTAKSVSLAADQVGAYQNAFTNTQTVAYYLQLVGSKTEVAMDLLSDMLLNAQFASAEIEKERGVVIQEIGMYADEPSSLVEYDWERLLFGDQPLGRKVVGSVENVRRFSREDFVANRDRLYVPENMVLAAAGALPKNFLALAEKYFSFPRRPMPGTVWEPFNRRLARQERVSFRKKDSEQAYVIIGALAPEDEHRMAPATTLLSAVLGDGMSSRLFLSVREERGLAYSIGTYYNKYTDTGWLDATAGVSPEKITPAIQAILAEFRDVYKNGVKVEELRKVKSMIDGKTALQLEGSDSVASFIGRQEILRGRMETPRQRLARLHAVTLKEVHEAAKLVLAPENLAMAVVGPFDDPAKFESLLDYERIPF